MPSGYLASSRQAFCFTLVLIVFRGTAAADFLTETVLDTSNNYLVGQLSADTDSLGRPHLLYTYNLFSDQATNTVVYATRSTGGWSAETVSTGSLHSPSHGLAIDSAGRAHIALIDIDTRDIVYGLRGPGGWSFETVASGAHTLAPAIALDSTGTPYIAFARSSGFQGGPQLASRDASGQWNLAPSLIPDRIIHDADEMDLVLDANDKPYLTYGTFLSFTGPDALTVVTTDDALGGALTVDFELQRDLQEATFKATDLVIDNDGVPRMLVTLATSTGPRIEHYVKAAGGWETDFFKKESASFQTPSSLAVDDQNQSLILRSRHHANIGSGAVELWTLGAGEPSFELVASGLHSGQGAPGLRNDIAVDDAGGVHMFFLSDIANGITYAYIPEPAGLLIWGVAFSLVAGRHRLRS